MSCDGGHLGFPTGIKNRKFVEDLPMIIPGQFGFNCPSGCARPCVEKMQLIFFVPPNEELEGYIAPQKIWMYPQK
jgi:hypothetical protein